MLLLTKIKLVVAAILVAIVAFLGFKTFGAVKSGIQVANIDSNLSLVDESQLKNLSSKAQNSYHQMMNAKQGIEDYNNSGFFGKLWKNITGNGADACAAKANTANNVFQSELSKEDSRVKVNIFQRALSKIKAFWPVTIAVVVIILLLLFFAKKKPKAAKKTETKAEVTKPKASMQPKSNDEETTTVQEKAERLFDILGYEDKLDFLKQHPDCGRDWNSVYEELLKEKEQ